MTADPARIAGALVVLLAWLLLCLTAARRCTGARRRAAPGAIAGDDAILIAFASQTGFAEELARRTGQSLRGAGQAVHILPFRDLTGDLLQRARRALFIASTTGEGDAPDDATRFTGRIMTAPLHLPQLSYAVLAPGDRSYRNFCGFGHRLDGWLRHRGATPLFDLTEVDDGDHGALRHWQRQLRRLGATADLADWEPPSFGHWLIAERRLLNPGSRGAAAFHLALSPTDDSLWQAGDIAEIAPRNDPGLPTRAYSIASLPADGRIDLLVRERRLRDGRLGLGSGWLTQEVPVGTAIALRIRRNRNFHGPEDDRPMILIGNGTGLAGLRAHLKARIAADHHENWLVFGERSRAHDYFHRTEIEAWLAAGAIARLDLAFSRDQLRRVYVQDRLRDAGDAVRDWVGRGSAIYVCGSAEGMAAGVDAALADILGGTQLAVLRERGRYRRDVY